MGVTKNIMKPGNGTDFPVHGKPVTVHYTGKLMIIFIQSYDLIIVFFNH